MTKITTHDGEHMFAVWLETDGFALCLASVEIPNGCPDEKKLLIQRQALESASDELSRRQQDIQTLISRWGA